MPFDRRLCLVLAFFTAAVAPGAAPPSPSRLDRMGDPLPTGALVRLGTLRLRQTDQINRAALAPDGKLAATVNYGQEIFLWELPGGKRRALLRGHKAVVGCLAFSPNGRTLASSDGAQDNAGELRLWDASTGNLQRIIALPKGAIRLAFSPDGHTLAVGVYRVGVALWDVAAGKKGRWFADQKCGGSLAFSPDGALLATSREDGGILLWDAKTHREKRQLLGHTAEALGLTFSPDGKRLATGGTDATIRVWDVAGGKEVRRIDTGPVWTNQVHFADQGRALLGVTHGTRLCRWNLATGKAVTLWEDDRHAICALNFTADGRAAVLAGINGAHHLRLIDLIGKKEVIPAPGHNSFVSCIAFSADDKCIATSSWFRDDRSIRFWDAATGRLLRELKGHQGGVSALAVSPDGKTLASAEWGGGLVHLWDASTGRPLRTLKGHYGSVISLAFSPDGKTLASGDNRYIGGPCRGQVFLWDVQRGKSLRVLTNHPGMVRSVAFSPDGRTLATGSGQVFLWDVASGKRKRQLPEKDYLAYSPDGRLLACALGGQIGVCEARTGDLLFRRQAHKRVRSIAFSPAGGVLATGGLDDSVVRLWDPIDGQPLRAFRAELGSDVTSVAFSHDGRKLASGHTNTTALVWDLRGVQQAADVKPGSVDLARLWDDLGSNAGRAYQAVRLLSRNPAPSVRYLEKRLHPTPAGLEKRLVRLVADLASDAFAAREKASMELARAGRSAERSLRTALESKPSLEQHRRITNLLQKLEAGYSEEELRPLRAVAVLERINNDAARQLLTRLAAGDPSSLLTRDAIASLRRLAVNGRSK